MASLIRRVSQSPVIFNDDKHLYPNVRKVLLQVVQDILDSLEEDGVHVSPKFVVITGSMTGFDYKETSDIDLHIGYNPSDFDEPGLAKAMFRYYQKTFNAEPYDLRGHPIELYFQDVNEEHISPGVYDLVADDWIEYPSDSPNVNAEAVDEFYNGMVALIDDCVISYEQQKDKMTMQDRKRFLSDTKILRNFIRHKRSEGLHSPAGIYSVQNLGFKQLRDHLDLQRLSDLIHQVQDDVYEV